METNLVQPCSWAVYCISENCQARIDDAPATVILDAARTVRWIDVHPDYSTRTEPRQVIDALDHLGH